MISDKTQFILTDIEGTTTSISFVYEILFPYFRNNINNLKELQHLQEVQEAFQQTVELTKEAEGINLTNTDEIVQKLLEWSIADKKITPLKTLQGILWEKGYKTGLIKGHVYNDVAENLKNWQNKGIQLGVFSSGSVAAQKLIFKYSTLGDLTTYFSYYFDTKTGGKREAKTYQKISDEINILPENILFLSDIKEELEAAEIAGYQTIQLIREGVKENWKSYAKNFSEIN